MALPADSDNPHWKQRQKRREADINFIARVVALREAGDVDGLTQVLRDHMRGPQWKVICIQRALVSALATKEEK